MKKILHEYSYIIGMTFTGLVFGFATFILIVNVYHMKEVNTTYVRTDGDKTVIEQTKEKLNLAKLNISNFNSNTYRGANSTTELSTIQANLNACIKSYEDKEITTLINKEVLTISDVYKLQKSYQDDIINECIVKRTYALTVQGEEKHYSIQGLDDVAPFLRANADSIINSTNFIRKWVENNSNYSFTSQYTKDNFIEMTRDSYTEIVSEYSKSVDYIYNLSEWFNKVSGGM